MMIWAIADLHLSFGTAHKEMDVFGNQWVKHYEKVKQHWIERIKADDLVLIAGDLSWAKHPESALPDLEWLDALPGVKVIIRGNHDYWWGSLTKVKKVCPPSVHPIHNNVFQWGDIEVGGARLWNTAEFHFDDFIDKIESPYSKGEKFTSEDNEKIFLRELNRLEMSLRCFSKEAKKRIVMTHYPPIGADLSPSRVSTLLQKYDVDTCVFGHLHSVKLGVLSFGRSQGVAYHLTSCDYLDFIPLQI